ARAIQSKDLTELRRAYPGLTPAQQTGWEQFFQSVQTIKASLALSSLDVNGNSAEGAVTGAYDYVDASSGRTEHRPVSFKISMRRAEGGAWRLTAVR
ncbi:MAG: hypothetical protein M3081_22255, partial [Gemmatimonadota bacterium]|nr:hypothetical protein [Gemmatimonadota bacterium]